MYSHDESKSSMKMEVGKNPNCWHHIVSLDTLGYSYYLDNDDLNQFWTFLHKIVLNWTKVNLSQTITISGLNNKLLDWRIYNFTMQYFKACKVDYEINIEG